MDEPIVRFCPYCGNPVDTREFAGQERPVCPKCNWVHFSDPKVAAGALVIHEDKVLLVRRKMNPQRGYWAVPAGFVDAYEDPVEAAARECLEETGLIVKISGLFAVLSGREHPRGADIFIAYHATVSGGELKAGDDAVKVKFFTRERLPQLAFNTTRQVLDIWMAKQKNNLQC